MHLSEFSQNGMARAARRKQDWRPVLNGQLRKRACGNLTTGEGDAPETDRDFTHPVRRSAILTYVQDRARESPRP
jgi:hypothetical protein